MFKFIGHKARRDIKEKNISRLSFFIVRLLTVVVFLLCTPDMIPAQDNLARINQIKEQMMVLNKELESCKDTECQTRMLPEMQRLLDEYTKIFSEESAKISTETTRLAEEANKKAAEKPAGGANTDEVGESNGKTIPPRPWAPRRYSSDSEYLEAQLRCEPWIDHVQRWCIEEPNPAIREVNCERASEKMCIPLKVTMRARVKFYNSDSKCGHVKEEFYQDYRISTSGVMTYSSDFSNFDLGVFPPFMTPVFPFSSGETFNWDQASNSFQIEINQAQGYLLETDHDNPCSVIKKRKFTKSDITYEDNIPPYFELSINYPTDKKRLNLVYKSKVFLIFSGYEHGILTDGNKTINEHFQPEMSYFITPEIMRRALSEKKLQHTFDLKYDQSSRWGQVYRNTTLDMDIAFGPFDCGGNKDNTPGSVAFSGSCTEDGGIVVGRRGSVFVNGKPIARAGDRVFSTFDGVVEIVGKQDWKVFVEGKPVARVGDVTTKGVKIIGGSKDTFLGQ